MLLIRVPQPGPGMVTGAPETGAKSARTASEGIAAQRGMGCRFHGDLETRAASRDGVAASLKARRHEPGLNPLTSGS